MKLLDILKPNTVSPWKQLLFNGFLKPALTLLDGKFTLAYWWSATWGRLPSIIRMGTIEQVLLSEPKKPF